MVFSVDYIHTEACIILFHSSDKSSCAACDWTDEFFSRVKSVVRGLSLARTHLRTNYDMAFSCVLPSRSFVLRWPWNSPAVKFIFVYLHILLQELDALFGTWGDLPQHGPILLAWAVFRFVTMEPGQEQVMSSVLLVTPIFPAESIDGVCLDHRVWLRRVGLSPHQQVRSCGTVKLLSTIYVEQTRWKVR